MSTSSERMRLKSVYKNSPSWSAKVDKMSDSQVIAIFKRFEREKKL